MTSARFLLRDRRIFKRTLATFYAFGFIMTEDCFSVSQSLSKKTTQTIRGRPVIKSTRYYHFKASQISLLPPTLDGFYVAGNALTPDCHPRCLHLVFWLGNSICLSFLIDVARVVTTNTGTGVSPMAVFPAPASLTYPRRPTYELSPGSR